MIEYVIYKTDEYHLKESETLSKTEKRVCLIKCKLDGWDRNSFESMDAAVEYIKNNMPRYVDYTILPSIYLTED